MINNIAGGIAVPGVPGVGVPERESKSPPGASSFGEVLSGKMQSAKKPDKEASQEVKRDQTQEGRSSDRDRKQADSGRKKEKTDEVSQDSKSAKLNSGSKKQAIKKFMDSIESEFGIPSTRLVESIADLNAPEALTQLEAKLKETMAELGLDKEAEQKAMALFAALMAEVKGSQAPVADMVKESAGPSPQVMPAILDTAKPAGPTKEAAAVIAKPSQSSAPLMAPKGVEVNASAFEALSAEVPEMSDGQIEELLQSLSSEEAVADTLPDMVELPLEPQVSRMPLAMDSKALAGKQPVQDLSPIALAALMAKQQKTQGLGENLGADVDGLSEGGGLSSSMPLALNQSTSKLNAQDQLMAKNPIATMNVDQNMNLQMRQLMDQFRQNSSGQQQMGGESSQSSASSSLQEGMGDLKAAEFKGTLDSLSPHLMPLKTELHLSGNPAVAGAGGTMATVTPEDQEANIKQILSQAQILVKKGGGEMSLRMSPEGMGEIHLKVLMQDGKMNMQLHTDSQDAKKIIESSLAELKTSLAAQKLSLDHVKVDVVSSTNTENSTNNQSNMNSQSGQDQSRKFWQGFNESFGNGPRRESFFGSPSGNGYGSKKPTPLQPIENVQVQSTQRVTNGRGQGLNLVA